jgi:hypothetical protein
LKAFFFPHAEKKKSKKSPFSLIHISSFVVRERETFARPPNHHHQKEEEEE